MGIQLHDVCWLTGLRSPAAIAQRFNSSSIFAVGLCPTAKYVVCPIDKPAGLKVVSAIASYVNVMSPPTRDEVVGA